MGFACHQGRAINKTKQKTSPASSVGHRRREQTSDLNTSNAESGTVVSWLWQCFLQMMNLYKQPTDEHQIHSTSLLCPGRSWSMEESGFFKTTFNSNTQWPIAISSAITAHDYSRLQSLQPRPQSPWRTSETARQGAHTLHSKTGNGMAMMPYSSIFLKITHEPMHTAKQRGKEMPKNPLQLFNTGSGEGRALLWIQINMSPSGSETIKQRHFAPEAQYE